jgi:hypothetical protein
MLCKAIKEGHQSPGTRLRSRHKPVSERSTNMRVIAMNTRGQMQHELANCTAVQLIDIRVPKS